MFKKTFSALLGAAVLTGCASLPRSELDTPKTLPSPLPIEQPASAAVMGAGNDFAVDLRGVAGEQMFVSQPQLVGDPLPDVAVPAFSVSNATVYDFLRTILAGTSIAFSVDNAHPGAAVTRNFVSATNISGTLKSVLDAFSNSMGYYYYYTGGVLHVTPDRQYVARIPPVNELFDSLAPMLKTFGATDVLIDKTSRAVTYRASKPTQDRVESYLKWLRGNRKLIVYETFIAEVLLTDSTSTGIQWNKLAGMGTAAKVPVTVSLAGGSSGIAGAGAIGLSTVVTGKLFAVDALVSFLQTQGTVNQLSRIPMMLVSGGDAVFRNGGTDYYVSSISAPTVTATGQVLQGQAQLTPLRTGIDLKLSGDIYDGTVFTKLDLSMNALTGYRSFPAGQGQAMQAPITSERAVVTEVRVRPGDAILIAGINYEKYQADTSGLPGVRGAVTLAADNNRSLARSELVIVVRPKVIQFSQAPEPAAEREGLEEQRGAP